MKIIGVISLLVYLSAMVSCADGAPDYYSSPASNVSTPAPNNASPNINVPVSLPNSTGNGGTTSNPGGNNLNPAHGQPGHRCDIPVGQPLNSAPKAGIAFTPPNVKSVQPALNPPQGQPLSNTPNAGMIFNQQNVRTVAPALNPPHGQPFHRCDIPVGQPLNSKPAVSAPTPASTSTSSAAPTTTILSATALNPKHGEPGHRCDIPVGQPLNSKPAAAVTLK